MTMPSIYTKPIYTKPVLYRYVYIGDNINNEPSYIKVKNYSINHINDIIRHVQYIKLLK